MSVCVHIYTNIHACMHACMHGCMHADCARPHMCAFMCTPASLRFLFHCFLGREKSINDPTTMSVHKTNVKRTSYQHIWLGSGPLLGEGGRSHSLVTPSTGVGGYSI